jgi:membrane protein DedA with SNARE-associated domain
MNALGAVAWATLFGGGAYLLGNQIDRVAGPLGFGLLAITVLGAVIGLAFVRRHENELARRADIALAIHQRKRQASA